MDHRPHTLPMRSALLLLTLTLGLAACAQHDDEADVTVQGVDPVQTDADMAPDTYVEPGGPTMAPDAPLAPEDDLQPADSLQPDATPPVIVP